MNSPKTRHLSLLIASVLSAASLVATQASTSMDDYIVRNRIDFETLEIGASPTTGTDNWAAWTGSSLVKGAAPSAPAKNTSQVALAAPGTTRLAGFSDQQVNPFTAEDDTIFFSAWIYRASGSSGARLLIGDTNTGGAIDHRLGGFGIVDLATPTFALYDGATNDWISSDLKASNNSWYEVALVIKIDNSDISKSLASLYVRNITANQDEFSLVTFNEGATTELEMSWFTDEWNARDHFAYWRYYNFRSDAQIDNLTAGVIAIPEPSSAALGMGGLALFCLLKGRLARK